MIIKDLTASYVDIERQDHSFLQKEGKEAFKAFKLVVNEILHLSRRGPSNSNEYLLKRSFKQVEKYIRLALKKRTDVKEPHLFYRKLKKCFGVASKLFEKKHPSFKGRKVHALARSRYSQFDMPFSREIKDRSLLRALTNSGDKLDVVTEEAVDKHQSFSKIQNHSCGANALEAMLYILGSEQEDFSARDIEEIIGRGVAQYRVLEDDRIARKHSSDPTIRMLAKFAAESDGATIHQIAGYYTPKGLDELERGEGVTPVTKSTLAASLYDVASLLKPGQGVIINLAGNDISISCKELEDGSIGYFLFDSHATESVGAILHKSNSLEETINTLMDRIGFRVSQIEFKFFGFNKGRFDGYCASFSKMDCD